MSNTHFHWKNLPALSLQKNEQLVRDWDRLNEDHGGLPFLTSDALICTLKILGRGHERLLIATQNSTVVAMFLLLPQGLFRWQTFQPAQLPLGAWVARADLHLPNIVHSLLRGPLGFCLVLSITQIDPHIAPRSTDTADNQNDDYIETGWINIEGSFDAYWKIRGKNLRQNMQKQRAKLQTEGIKLTMQVLQEFADMAPAVARYGLIESTGWKAQKGTAIHPDNAQGHYYRELLENASLRGEALIYQYFFDDRVVAMNLCLVRHGTLIVLKTTYDESIKSYSPAFLLRENELQEIYREGRIKRLEYFGRLMEWHTKWTTKKRTLYHLTLYRWPFLKKLAAWRRRKAKQTIPVAAVLPIL